MSMVQQDLIREWERKFMLYKYRKYFIALGLLLLCIVGVMMMNFFNKMAFGNVNIPRNSTKVNTQNTSNN